MAEPQIDHVLRRNQLLGALEPAIRKRVEPHLELAPFKLGDLVCEAGGLLQHAYFPEGSVLSLLTVLENGNAIETANIGREGAFGLFAAMYSRVSFNRCIVQMAGPMVRCKIEVLQAEFDRSAHVRDLFVSYSETLLSQIMQTVACNALHTVEERTSRWLLMMHDRADGETLTYTHEFLSHILGVDRKSISLAAQSMQNAGLISYRRGAMHVVDRPGFHTSQMSSFCGMRAKHFSRSGSIRAHVRGTSATNRIAHRVCYQRAFRDLWPNRNMTVSQQPRQPRLR